MKLGLRAKYAIGFGGLLLVLLVLAGASLVWVSRLGGSIEVILEENYRSVVACQDMKEALERMDSGALFALTGDPQQGQTLVRVHGPRFERALERERSNVTLPGEQERVVRIGVLYEDFRRFLDQVVDPEDALADRRRLYFGKLLPTFQQLKREADEILRINQEAMVAASVSARELAAQGRQQMLGLSLVGAVVAALFVLFLSRTTLTPIRRLTESAREIEEGHLELAVDAGQDDEIGELAAAFNSMARRLRQLRRSDRERLIRAQKTSSLAINSLRDAVFLLSPDHEVELANRSARSLLDVAPGCPIPGCHDDWLAPLLADVGPAVGDGVARSYGDTLQLFVDGEERFYLPSAVAIRDDELALLGITVVLSDVTELRKLDEMRSDLVATASHELMTPVTSLAMAVHVLLAERAGGLNPRQAELLTGARDDVQRLRRIIEGVLDVARLEQGAAPLEIEDVPVERLLEAGIGPMRAAFEERGISLEVRNGAEGVEVEADQRRLALVFRNLLDNALSHSADDGTVTVDVSAVEGRIRFAVVDRGPGIPKEDRERVFEKFYQLQGTDTGVGLGLAIAREIVVAHGGRIWCESTVGSGSSFAFELPGPGPGPHTGGEGEPAGT